LFIKNSEEAKKINNNLAGENADAQASSENAAIIENAVESSVMGGQADIIQDKVVTEKKNIFASTAPVIAKPAATNSKNIVSNTAPQSVNTNTNNTSTKKSSAKTKTS
jgi:hypothetical protein